MIYSRSTEYAIRALVPLAQVPEGRYTMVKTIAEQEKIPTHFLAKILQQLARKGLLRSSKGPQGGFTLQHKAEDIRLLDIVEALDGLEAYGIGVNGNGRKAGSVEFCDMHHEWLVLRNQILDYLKGNTVADLARSLEAKRRTLARKGRRRAAAARA